MEAGAGKANVHSRRKMGVTVKSVMVHPLTDANVDIDIGYADRNCL